jgi:hypothetical protein
MESGLKRGSSKRAGCYLENADRIDFFDNRMAPMVRHETYNFFGLTSYVSLLNTVRQPREVQSAKSSELASPAILADDPLFINYEYILIPAFYPDINTSCFLT